MVEANEYPELSRRYSVQGVPRTVINGRLYAEGALPEGQFVSALAAGLSREGEADIVALAREE